MHQTQHAALRRTSPFKRRPIAFQTRLSQGELSYGRLGNSSSTRSRELVIAYPRLDVRNKASLSKRQICGRAGRCQQEKMMTTAVERRGLLVPTVGRISSIASDAYSAAALLEAPMQLAVDVLEPLRREATKADDVYRLGRAFNAAVCKVVGQSLLPIVMGMRDRYLEAAADLVSELVSDASSSNADRGFSEWLRAFGEALGEYQFTMCARLTRPGWLQGIDEEWRSLLASATNHARDERWELVRPTLDRLLETDVWEEGERAPLLAMASLIEIFVLGDLTSARRLADRAIEDAPRHARAAEALAECLVSDNRREDAESLLLGVLESEPDSGIVYAALGRCARVFGDSQTAEEHLLNGMRQAPDFGQIYTELLTLYSAADMFAEREARLPLIAAQGCAVDPDSSYTTQLTLGCAYRDNGAFDRARDVFERAVASAPKQVLAYVELARLFLKQKNIPAAHEQLEKAIALDPTSADTAGTYAELYEAENDLVPAIEWSQAQVNLTVGNPFLELAQLAVRQQAAGEAEAGWRSARQAVDASPNDSRLLDLLSDLVASRWVNSPEDVRQFYARFLDVKGKGFPGVYYNLIGNAAYQMSDDEAAVNEYRSAIEVEPDDPVYHRNLARALRDLGRWDEALSALADAYALDHDETVDQTETAWVFNGRGNAAYDEGDYIEAVKAYERAVQLSPKQAVLRGNLALALLEDIQPGQRLARLERAVDALAPAADLEPDSDYGVRLAHLQARLARVQRFGELIDTPTEVRPITIEFADDLVPKVDEAQRGQRVFSEQIPAMRARLRARLGFDVPGLLLRDSFLAENEYRILFFGAIRAAGRAMPDYDCVLAASDVLIERGLSQHELSDAVDPVTGAACTWARPELLDGANLDGLDRRSDVDMVLRHVEDLIRRHAGLFFGLDCAEDWLAADPLTAASSAAPRSPDADRSVAGRRLALERGLRTCTQEGIILDNVLLKRLQETIGAMAANGGGELGAEATRTARLSLADRLRLRHVHSMPEWAEDILANGRLLSALEEHKVIMDLDPEVQAHHTVTAVTDVTAARPYLQRLLGDRFATLAGGDVNVLTKQEASLVANASGANTEAHGARPS